MWCLTTDRGRQKHFLVVLVEDKQKLDNRDVHVRRVIACIHHSHVMRCVYRAYSSTYLGMIVGMMEILFFPHGSTSSVQTTE